MDSSHPIVSLLAGGVTPTPDEARDLTALGAFTASLFSRHLHGLERPPAGTARPGEWASHLTGRLSASTGTRWTEGMGLGADYDDGAWASYWALAAGAREGYSGLDAGPRETVALFDDEEGFAYANAEPPARRPARRGSLFGRRRMQHRAGARRARAARATRSGQALRPAQQELLAWPDGSTVHTDVARALAAGGLRVSDQVGTATHASELTGGGSTASVSRMAEVSGGAAPAATRHVGSAGRRVGRRVERAGAPGLRLDSLVVDRRTPALQAALSLADEALSVRPARAGAFALSAARTGRTLGLGADAQSSWGAPQGASRAQYFSFFDAVEGDFLTLTPEQPWDEATSSPGSSRAPVTVARAAGAVGAPPSGQLSARSPRPSAPATARAGSASRPVRGSAPGTIRLDDITPLGGPSVRSWTRDNVRPHADGLGPDRGGRGRLGRLVPEVVRDVAGAPRPRQHRASVSAPTLWTLPLSLAARQVPMLAGVARSAAASSGARREGRGRARQEGGAPAAPRVQRDLARRVATGEGASDGAVARFAEPALQSMSGAVGAETSAVGPPSVLVASGWADAVPEGMAVPSWAAGAWVAEDQGPVLPLAATLTRQELLAGSVATRHAAPRVGGEGFQPVVARGRETAAREWGFAGASEPLDGVAWVVLQHSEGGEAVPALARAGGTRGQGRPALPLSAVPAGRPATMVPATVALLASAGTGARALQRQTLRSLDTSLGDRAAGGGSGGERLGEGAGEMLSASDGRGVPLPLGAEGRVSVDALGAGSRGVVERAPGGASPTQGLLRTRGVVTAAGLGEALAAWAGMRSEPGAEGWHLWSERVARGVTVGAYGALDAADVAGVVVQLQGGVADGGDGSARSAERSSTGPRHAAASGRSTTRPQRRAVGGEPVVARVAGSEPRAWAEMGRDLAPLTSTAGRGKAPGAPGRAWGVAASARRALLRPVVTGREARAAVALLGAKGTLAEVLRRSGVGEGAQDAPLTPPLARRLEAVALRDVRLMAPGVGGAELAAGVSQLGSLSPAGRRAAAAYLRRAGWGEAELEVLRLSEPGGAEAAAGVAPSAGRPAVAEVGAGPAETGAAEGRRSAVAAPSTTATGGQRLSGRREQAARRLSSNLARVLAGGEATSVVGADGSPRAAVQDAVGATAERSSLLRRGQDAYFGALGVSPLKATLTSAGEGTAGDGAPGRGARWSGGLGDWLLMDLLSFAGADERALDAAEAVLPRGVRQRVLARAEALGLGPEAAPSERRRGYAQVFAELGLVDLGSSDGARGLEERLGAALGAVTDSGVGRRAQASSVVASPDGSRLGRREGAATMPAGGSGGLDPTLAGVFAPEKVLRGLVGADAPASRSSRLARLGGPGVLAAIQGEPLDQRAGASSGAVATGGAFRSAATDGDGAAAVAGRRRDALRVDTVSGPAMAREFLGLGGARRRRGSEGRLGRLLARLGRKERTSVFGRADSADFAFAWLGRVDGTRSGFDLGLGGERTAFDSAFGVDRGGAGGAWARTSQGGRRSRVASESPVGGADLVSPASGGASESPRQDKSGLRRLLRSAQPASTSSGGSSGMGASAAMRSVDWRYVETGSTATPAASVDYGQLAAAAVRELGPSRVSLPYVAPAVKAVAQSALLEPRNAPAEGSGSAPPQSGGTGGNKGAEGGGGQPTLSKAAMKKLAIEMADRVARLLQREKERRGKWA